MPTVVASDNFNRANGPLGANWQANRSMANTPTAMQIISNEAAGDVSGETPSSYWSANAFADDQYSQAVIRGVAAVRVSVRGAGNASNAPRGYYFVVRQSDGIWNISRFNGDFTGTVLTSGTSSFSIGDTIRLEVVGSTLVARVNGFLFATMSDGTSTNIDGLLDNWEGGNMADVAGTWPGYIAAEGWF